MGKTVDLGEQIPGNFWESRLVTDELLEAASQDPQLWPDAAKRIAHFDVNLRNGGLAWQESAQLAIKQIGGASGIPAELAGTLAADVVNLFTGTPGSIKELSTGLAHAGIGLVTTALSAIPIVGPIAGAIGALSSFLINLATYEPPVAAEVLPPLQDYKDEVDEAVVNTQVLPTLGTLDWTGLFLPRYEGEWGAHAREHGWAMRPRSGGSGVGMVPGTQRMSGILQTYFVAKSRMEQEAWGTNLADARDQGSFYPGATQILTAVLEQVAKAQTQLYNVDTHEIEKRWRDYILGAIAWASDAWKGNKAALAGTKLSELSELQRRTVIGAMMSRLTVSTVGDCDGGACIGGVGTYTWEPSNQGTNVFDAFIKPWCDRIRQRQEHYLGTIIGTAYTDPSQAAFAGDQQLALKLTINRGLLLKSQYRSEVRVNNMIDRDYADEIFASTVGQRFTSRLPVEGATLDPDAPPDAPPEPPGGGVPFGEWLESPRASGVGALMVGAAALGGAYLLGRKKGWF